MAGAMVATMMRAIAVCASVLASCVATGNSAQDLTPGKIVSVGQNTYKVRVVNEPVDVADRQAMKRASEHCAKMNQTMVVKSKAFDMGYGYTLTWTCRPLQNTPINH